MDNIVISVSQLNEYVEAVISQDPLLSDIYVEGEISGFKRYGSGHCYFSLKDADAVVRCVYFKHYNQYLRFQPKDGMRVIVRGSASFYAKDGNFQITVISMKEVGEGELYRRFIELKAKLESEGMFDEQYKKPIPFLPRCVGVATSNTGAVFHDIVKVISRRFPKMNILLCHCSVQGVDAPREIISAIHHLDSIDFVDVIIVGRGGGSYEDLIAFNDEGVARAIFECETPIISAVGHETDYTIADFVADMRAPTPSAAAELAVPVLSELLSDLNDERNSLYEYSISFISDLRSEIESLAQSSSFAVAHSKLDLLKAEVAEIESKLFSAAEKQLLEYKYDYKSILKELSSLSPKAVLKRGYAIVKNNRGKIVSSAAELNQALDISNSATIEFHDDSVKVQRVE